MYGQNQSSQFDKVLSQIKSNKPNDTSYGQHGQKLHHRTHRHTKKSLSDELSRYFLDA